MGSVIILHIADCHLDSSFAAAGLSPEFARQRATELKDAFAAALAVGKEAGARVVLVAGDLFEARGARVATVRFVAERLAELNATVFIAPGNHDPAHAGSCYDAIRWPENVHIFGARWESVVLPELGVEVRGYGFDRYELNEPLLGAIPPAQRPDLVQLVVLHGSLVAARGSGERPAEPDAPLGWREGAYLPFTAAELAASRADYVALGHYHRHLVAWRDGDRALARYPGPPESLDFGDRGEHGAIVGRVGKGQVDLRLVPVGRREHIVSDCDLTGCATPEEAARRIVAVARPEDRARHLYRVRLTGLLDPEFTLDLAELRGLLAQEFIALRLSDESQPDFDLASLSAEQGVRGAFVRRMQRLLQEREGAADGAGAAQAAAALRAGLLALRGQAPPVMR